MSNNNDLKRRLIAAFPVASWPEWAICIVVDKEGTVVAYSFTSSAMRMPTQFSPRFRTIGSFILQPGDDWRDTLITREEAERISRPEHPDDQQIVLIQTQDMNGANAWAIGYRVDGLWIETSLWGASDIIGTPIVDWQYLPKLHTNEQQ